MQCRDLMRRPVENVSPHQSAVTAARAMREKNIGLLAVSDLAGCLVGVVTDRDLAVHVLGEDRDPIATQVADVMTAEVVTCRPEDDLVRAEELMRQHHKSRIVVVDESNRPVGIISLADVAQADRAGAADTLAAVAAREVLDHRGAPAR